MAQRPSRHSPKPRRARPPDGDEPRSPLRLAAARGSLALELYEPVMVGPIEVSELSLSLVGLKFPVDLSGGVPRFRQRRGDLEHATLRLDATRLAQWLTGAAGKASEGSLARAVLWPLEDGFGVGLSGERAALAFDLLWAPAEGEAQLVVTRARAVGLDQPALGVALRLADSVLGRFASRRGRRIVVPGAAAKLSRAVLPLLGARAPRARSARFGLLEWRGELAELALDSTFAPAALGVNAARALEQSALTVAADDALADNDLERARAEYLSILERAPRQPEVSLAVAEIDLFRGLDPAAALGVVTEALPVSSAGLIAAELLGRSGDLDSARAGFEASARTELFGPLAALSLWRLAELEPELPGRLAALDLAVARAPASSSVRLARLAARLTAGDVRGAMADAEHLEAAAHGSRARYAACLEVGETLSAHGFARQAGKLFERALRYAPEDAQASAGLARALAQTGNSTRAIALFERALRLSEPDSDVATVTLLELAKLVADELGDLPQAIARVREIPAGAQGALEARYREASWRARLGDLVGAGLAYARLRDALVVAAGERGAAPAGAVEWLLEAARFAEEQGQDIAAAERHLAVLLRLAPQHERAGREYRRVAARLAERQRAEERVETPIAVNRALLEDEPDEPADPERLEQEASRLEGALRADPENVAVALALVRVLEALGRDQDVLALVSARLEEAGPAERVELVPVARRILERLVSRALDAGRSDEAELYRVMHERIA